jgi:type VI protein secretion system component VasK
VRTQDVLVSVLDGAQVEAAVDRWRAAGVLVVAGETGGDQRWARDLAWTAIVGGLLLFGVYHLVQQARLHRREGSPRERLAEAQAELEAGRISREEFERRAAEITPEL